MKRMNRRVGIVFVILLTLIGSHMNGSMVRAEEEESIEACQVMISEAMDVYNVTPGTVMNLKVPVKAIGGLAYISNPYITLDLKELPLTQSSKVTLTRDAVAEPINYISSATTFINVSLKVKDTAKEGIYQLNMKFTYVYNGTPYETKLLTPIEIQVGKENTNAQLSVTSLSYPNDLKAGDKFQMSFNLKNQGELTAKDVYLVMEGYGPEGVLPDYTTEKRKIGDLAPGQSRKITFPIYVSSTATSGVKTLSMKTSYKDSQGVAVETDTTSIYIPVTGKAKTEASGEPNLILKDVKQSPAIPRAGGKLSVSFVIENKSKVDMKEVKITPTNLTASNFSPVESQPYKLISVIKAKGKKKVVMNFKVSDNITEGLNDISLQFSYKGIDGKVFTPEPAKVFILNVQKEENVTGVPKLIIHEFETGKEDLKAGKEFVFAFDIYNTHSSLSANNIKVTLSSEENSFSVTKGSNSFYISSIKAGQTVHKEVTLKVKPDCVTKAYPLKIDFEYEYQGMQKLENEISTGLKVSEVLNLQVLENSRPTVSNIVVGTWEPPVANTPCNMGFDFYNMGKSTLYNVMARVEGKDFTPTQQTKFIGNVEPGAGNTYEMELTPNIEGDTGHGTLIITYEDSNGNSYEVPTKFDAMVEAAQMPNPEEMSGELPLPEEKEKKEILPLWAFILIQVILLLMSIFVIRKIIIQLYKNKMHRLAEEE